ncbi:MAG TPA: universal stress protein [Longimicrobiales bacterium]|nr:universal stress protein [Longimicrobiales bacterium]
MERIVVGIDFSETSPEVTRWACAFLQEDGEAVLAHVLPGGPVPDFLKGLLPSAGEGSAGIEERAARLEELAGGLRCRTTARVLRGSPAAALARLGGEVGADLLAIGPRGRRASRLGTTAEQLVRSADRPVLVVREPRGPAPTRLLLAVDASPRGLEVLRMGKRLMTHFGATATVLHVLDEDLLVALRLTPEGSPEHTRGAQAIAAARGWIEEQVRLQQLPQERTTISAIFGSPIHEIAGRTEVGGADLVVMGSRGLGGVAREILGSVASGVLRAAWCPILVV